MSVDLHVQCPNGLKKMFPFFIKLFASFIALGNQVATVWASSSSGTPCSTTLTPSNDIKPTAASGYRFGLVATGLTKPRSIVFDPTGGLLVLQSGEGVTRLSFQDGGGTCLSVATKKNVLQDRDLNHGLALSADGRTIYASTAEAAYSWGYDSRQAAVSDDRQTLVVGMRTDDHNTRTLLLSQRAGDTLLINRGSTSNVDPEAAVISSGHSQLKAFDLSKVPDGGYKFNTQGLRLGWGLRNSVGIAEHPNTGGIYSVENSVDELMREGKDVHIDNPGEEMYSPASY
ncbi:MAG: hypothetical protein LQ351_002979 [Letrouitia transgressa]|nr:MAG: hypothetical protein LQ351_002979 [Letrouitia transgressa]